MLHALAVRARGYAALAVVVEQSRTLGKVLFFPASMVTVVSGVVLVATEDWQAFTDLWILLGFGGIVVAPVIQMTIAERARQRFTSLADSDRSLVLAAARALMLVNVIDLMVLLVVVWTKFAKRTLRPCSRPAHPDPGASFVLSHSGGEPCHYIRGRVHHGCHTPRRPRHAPSARSPRQERGNV